MLIPLALSVLLFHAPPSPSIDDDALTSRELAGIAEEQALLVRQLQRLRQTMEVLVLRLEAEGRPRAVELLNEGIRLLEERSVGARALTLEESMDDSRERIEKGQVVQSLGSQIEVIAGLERLLAILMERGNLDNIEENLDRVRELQKAIDALSGRERELRAQTNELRKSSANEQQKELQEGLAHALEKQRELLADNERSGRESGALELEQVEQALRQLRSDVDADAALLEAWQPEERGQLAQAGEAVENARRAEARAGRMDDAAELLRDSARGSSASSSPEEAARATEALEAGLERAERHARASSDEAAEKVAKALEAALRALREARESGGDRSAAATEADARAAELEAAAASERAAAAAAREAAQGELAELAERDSIAGLLAQDVRDELDRADAAVAEASGERLREQTEEATDEAARTLRAGLEDLDRMAEALSGSERALSAEAERLARGLSTMPVGATPSGAEAGRQLSKAAEALQAASDAARRGAPSPARSDVQQAQQALESAQRALAEARESAGEQGAERRAAEQKALAEATEAMQELPSEGSMEPVAEAAIGEALRQAERAMKGAAEDLARNKSASAAEQQREAMDALSRAREAARSGVRPSSPEDRKRAEELAAEQEEIREDILRLATREDEQRSPSATAALDRAGQAAEGASEQLESGQLDDAEEAEREVERELQDAKDELKKEEEQYEELRQEELLFRITEEVRTALDAQREQMKATREIDAERSDVDRPSRAHKIRLRRIAREEEAIGERAGELAAALADEQSVVFTEILNQVKEDLGDIALDLVEDGDWETGERVQARQRDVEESFEWLHEALQQEQRRRERDAQKEQQEEQQGMEPGAESENRLVPNHAELKLLRRLEVDIQESVERLLILYPELGDEEPSDVNPLILEDILRLATRHERTTELFGLFRARLGLPDPGKGDESGRDDEAGGATAPPGENDDAEDDR
jgi:hypothetical protein